MKKFADKALTFLNIFKKTFIESLIYLGIAFSSMIVNILVVLVIDPCLAEVEIDLISITKSNSFLYGGFTTISCSAMSMYYFYSRNNNKKRKIVPIIILFLIIISIALSTAILIQLQLYSLDFDFISIDRLYSNFIIMIVILVCAVSIYKWDSESIKEYDAQKKANEYREEKIIVDNIGGKLYRA